MLDKWQGFLPGNFVSLQKTGFRAGFLPSQKTGFREGEILGEILGNFSDLPRF